MVSGLEWILTADLWREGLQAGLKWRYGLSESGWNPGLGRLRFLQNNFYAYEDCALVGTKGYCDEGRDTPEHFEKLVNRELERLRMSFEMAAAEGFQRFIMFLHYPPTSIGEMESGFTRMAEEYGAEQVVYSHCHGAARYQDSFQGEVNGIEYSLVSSDYLKFKPGLILE